MPDLRRDFLNWRPDAEDFANDGLVKATNAVHDTEGWKQIELTTTTSFSTTGGLASITSIVTKPIGPGSDNFSAWISDNTLHVGMNGVTAVALGSAGGGSTGYPLSFATTGSNQFITFFDVCEIEGDATGDSLVYFVAQAQQNQAAPATLATLSSAGFFTITAI